MVQWIALNIYNGNGVIHDCPTLELQDTPDLGWCDSVPHGEVAVSHGRGKRPYLSHLVGGQLGASSASYILSVGDGLKMVRIDARPVLANNMIKLHPFGNGSIHLLPVPDMRWSGLPGSVCSAIAKALVNVSLPNPTPGLRVDFIIIGSSPPSVPKDKPNVMSDYLVFLDACLTGDGCYLAAPTHAEAGRIRRRSVRLGGHSAVLSLIDDPRAHQRRGGFCCVHCNTGEGIR